MLSKWLMKILLATSLVALLAVSGCESESNVEEVGEKIDQSIESVKDAAEEAGDTITGDGPAENVGESIDEAVEEVGEAVEGNAN